MDSFLEKDIRFLKGVGEKRAVQFNRLGVFTVQDLLYLFPRRYVDYSKPFQVAYAPYDEQCVVKATVLQVNSGVRISGGRTLFKVTCGDDTARLTLTFFNSEYTVKRLEVGEDYLFYGKIGGGMLSREMASPIFIPSDSPVTQQPIYPLTAGLSGKIISNVIANAFEGLREIADYMPLEITREYQLENLFTALHDIHFPADDLKLRAAKNRLVFNELFNLQLGLSLISSRQMKKNNIKTADTDISALLSSLPFSPTGAQLRAINDIIKSFSMPMSMNRLLQGDVGSGKTLVAVAAMYCMYKNGYQSCMMAPTEILAGQHFNSISNMLSPFGVRTALLTASTKAKERREILQGLSEGTIHILIGTHALLNAQVCFGDLGLSITDEQHRFGVKQRNLISSKGDNPHVLVMSATPIPRTLAMIIYANMQISVIDEMPKGRLPVKTLLVGTDKRSRMFSFVAQHIQQGYQTYIVLPAIEENETMTELASVEKYCNEVVKPLLPMARVAMLHGKMKAAEKESVMAAFSRGEIDILCSTTVIEVGVDVPNAVLMIIENAERYGLSALHQLRGRVGRNNIQSWCILVSDHQGSEVRQRLQFMCANNSGFAVSQYDLEHRGPGDFFGSRQHGLPALKIAQLADDISILQQTRQASENILQKSPDLSLYPLLKNEIAQMFKDITL